MTITTNEVLNSIEEMDPQDHSTFDQIILWARDRNLIEGSTPDKQFLKTVEELGELSKALGRGNIEQIKDGIGDVIVTLTILGAQLNMHVVDCVEIAYDEIKDRKGKMINGIFVKEADLQTEAA